MSNHKSWAGKATGPNGVATEMTVALEELGSAKKTRANEYLLFSLKPGAVECEQYRTVSLMITKTLLWIVMMTLRDQIHQETEQFGFVEDKDCFINRDDGTGRKSY